MAFYSLQFWFVVIILFGIDRLSKSKFNWPLLIGSYFIYGFWNVNLIPLLLLSSLTDFTVAFFVTPNRKKYVRYLGLIISLSVNLGLLLVFKYQIFPSLSSLLEATQRDDYFNVFGKASIPIGISFYTFQTLSYTFDSFKGKIKPSKNIIDYLLYVSFFPQLVAGPIERPKALLGQLVTRTKASREDVETGVCLVLWGLFKKVYVSGYLTTLITAGLATPNLTTISTLLIIFLAAYRIYADFSGYCDIAIGLALLFGIKLSINFRPMFFCRSPRDFWRRWHITLVSWVRDYVFIPLTSLRKTGPFLILSIYLSFVLIALWHELSVNWLIFGLFNASAFIIHNRYKKIIPRNNVTINKIREVFSIFGGQIFFCCNAFIFLTLDPIILSKVFLGLKSFVWKDILAYTIFSSALLPMTLIFIYDFLLEKNNDFFFIAKYNPLIKALFAAACLVFITFLSPIKSTEFIYFQF